MYDVPSYEIGRAFFSARRLKRSVRERFSGDLSARQGRGLFENAPCDQLGREKGTGKTASYASNSS